MLKANKPIHVIGAGLAGCEAAYQIIRYGIPVILHEMRPVKSDEAHKNCRLCGTCLQQFSACQ